MNPSLRPAPVHGRPFADGRYEIVECIGRGASGHAYRAWDLTSEFRREVCIKRLGGALPPEHGVALREEARLLAGVRHANVVSLLTMGEEESGAPFLVLELIDGWNLRALCRDLEEQNLLPDAGFVPDRVAIHIGCAVLRALAAVQRALPGLVHRDVTPHNILVSTEGEVKLTDFGIALALDRARWTRPSIVKGKLGFMAPEQIRGEALDVRTDLFAVGVVIYELLARVRPWGKPRGTSELRAIEHGEATPIAAHRRGVSPALVRVIERLLSPKREDRYASADDALRALAPFSAGEFGSLRLASIAGALLRSHDVRGGADDERT